MKDVGEEEKEEEQEDGQVSQQARGSFALRSGESSLIGAACVSCTGPPQAPSQGCGHCQRKNTLRDDAAVSGHPLPLGLSSSGIRRRCRRRCCHHNPASALEGGRSSHPQPIQCGSYGRRKARYSVALLGLRGCIGVDHRVECVGSASRSDRAEVPRAPQPNEEANPRTQGVDPQADSIRNPARRAESVAHSSSQRRAAF